eukprot:4537037-Prymnesium_polylepis.1
MRGRGVPTHDHLGGGGGGGGAGQAVRGAVPRGPDHRHDRLRRGGGAGHRRRRQRGARVRWPAAVCGGARRGVHRRAGR